MPSCFLSVPRVLTGSGCLESIGAEVAALGQAVLLVTGRSAMRKSGTLARVTSLLEASGCRVTIFDHVPPEPPVTSVDECRQLAQDTGAEVILGLGGGSAMDVAKAVAALRYESHPTVYYHDGGPWQQNKAAFFVGVPTTFGTASEVTVAGVYTNPETHEKKSIKHPLMLARLAVVDPELGVSASRMIKAASGMDALTQAIEGYCSRGATPMTEALSLAATKHLITYLPAFAGEDDSTEAEMRMAAEKVALGSTMAGMAFTNAGLGIVHAVAHPVGAKTEWPHGLLCGLLLHHALRFNRDAMGEKYMILSEMVNADIADFCEHLLPRVGVDATLGSCGIVEADLEQLITQTMPSGSLKANPRACSAQDVESFYRTAFNIVAG